MQLPLVVIERVERAHQPHYEERCEGRDHAVGTILPRYEPTPATFTSKLQDSSSPHALASMRKGRGRIQSRVRSECSVMPEESAATRKRIRTGPAVSRSRS